MKRFLLGMPAVISAFADAGALVAQSYENTFGISRSYKSNVLLSSMMNSQSNYFPPQIARLDSLKNEFGGYYTFSKGIKTLHCEIVPGLKAVVKGSRSNRAISYTLEWDREAWIVAAKSKWAVKDSVTQVYSSQDKMYCNKYKLFSFKLVIPLLGFNNNILTSMEMLMFESIFGQSIGLKRFVFTNLNEFATHTPFQEALETGKLSGLMYFEASHEA